MDTSRPCRRLLRPAIASLCLLPASAHAHATFQGLGPVVSGVLHPLTSPSHLLILIALSLFGAQRSSRRALSPIGTFAVAAALALSVTTAGLFATVPVPILSGVALVVCALVALRMPVPLWASRVLYGVAAIAIALDSMVEQGTPVVIAKTLFGTWLGAVGLLVTIAGYVPYCPRREWVKIAVRVLASWIIAISLLMLAFSLRKVRGMG